MGDWSVEIFWAVKRMKTEMCSLTQSGLSSEGRCLQGLLESGIWATFIMYTSLCLNVTQ